VGGFTSFRLGIGSVRTAWRLRCRIAGRQIRADRSWAAGPEGQRSPRNRDPFRRCALDPLSCAPDRLTTRCPRWRSHNAHTRRRDPPQRPGLPIRELRVRQALPGNGRDAVDGLVWRRAIFEWLEGWCSPQARGAAGASPHDFVDPLRAPVLMLSPEAAVRSQPQRVVVRGSCQCRIK